MTDTAPPKTTTTVTIDGRAVEAAPGEWVIAAAERAGIYIPRFCYHPRMRPVGMCRMCLVEIDTGRGPALQPACMIPVADGMTVETASPVAKKAQEGVLEFLLINHPLDCPVCDKGGACPLQDLDMSYGPGESRFVEEKRHFEKPIPISDLVYLDRERCILCDRCTRFSAEIAGDPLISFVDRGGHTQINTFPDEPFASYFSGNTVQICPVGALTARPYRFRARPWDLDQVESTCTFCSVGCRMAVQSTEDRLVRHLGIDVDPVNQGWLCDKGRFQFEALSSTDRLGVPLVRDGDALVEASWSDAMARASDALGAARGRVAVLGGARLPNEGAYAWSKLARTVLGTDDVDCQLGDGLPAEAVLGLPKASIDAACAADTIVLLGPDLKEEVPVLHLRIKAAVLDRGAKLIELSPTATSMTRYATVSLRYRPGEAAALVRSVLDGGGGAAGNGQQAGVDAASALLREGTVVCLLGRGSLAESGGSVLDAAGALLDALPEVTFLSTLRRANVHGALDMGLAPGVLPGRMGLDDGRDHWSGAWSAELPDAAGRDALGILSAAAEGGIEALVLLGADPLADFPDRDLARRALERVPFVLAVDTFLTASSSVASVVLPAASFGEVDGTTTNLEGRVSSLNAKVSPPGTARPDWMIAVELADWMGADLGFGSVEEVQDEIASSVPTHARVKRVRLATLEGLDGILAGDVRDVRGAGAPPSMSETEAPDILAVPKHQSSGVAESGNGRGAQPDASDGVGNGGPEAVGEAMAIAGSEGEYAEGQTPADGAASDATAEAIELSVEAESETPGEETSVAASGGGAGSTPPAPGTIPLLRHRPGTASPALPAVDGYSLRLVSGRRLYDDGTLVQHAPSLARIAVRSPLLVNAADLERLGLQSGDEVRVTSARSSSVLVAEASEAVPRGTASLPFNQVGGGGAADLVDATGPVTDVRVETIS